MLTPADASAAIWDAIAPLPGTESVPLLAATGRVLAETLVTERDLPPFDRVAMDGIAIRHDDWAGGWRRYAVDGVVGAGSEPPPLAAGGRCLEVMTGAMLPSGADTVVPVELIQLADGAAEITAPSVVAGANVHRRASDGLAGEVALAMGTVLRGPEIAVAASIGRASLNVRCRPCIAVISTGDELVGPHDPLLPWQIRRSNAQGIVALLHSRGHTDVVDEHIGDQRDTLRERIGALLAQRDVLVLSGGVSAGRFDHVPGVLRDLHVRPVFHKIAQRPGKPLWFGVGPEGQAVFALPGNPVSTLVCLVRYVLPALARLCGVACLDPAEVLLDSAGSGSGSLTAFVPAIRVAPGSPAVRLHQTRGSGDFISLVGTDGFVELAADRQFAPGDAVPFYTWSP